MLGRTHFKVCGTRDSGTRVDQIFGIKLLGTIVALVAARVFEPAVGAGAFDIAVGQKAAIGPRIYLTLFNLFDQPLIVQSTREMLG